jgi:hypothetical protein
MLHASSEHRADRRAQSRWCLSGRCWRLLPLPPGSCTRQGLSPRKHSTRPLFLLPFGDTTCREPALLPDWDSSSWSPSVEPSKYSSWLLLFWACELQVVFVGGCGSKIYFPSCCCAFGAEKGPQGTRAQCVLSRKPGGSRLCFLKSTETQH